MLVLAHIPVMGLEAFLGLIEEPEGVKLRENAGSLRFSQSKGESRHGDRRQFAFMLRGNAQHVHPMLEHLG